MLRQHKNSPAVLNRRVEFNLFKTVHPKGSIPASWPIGVMNLRAMGPFLFEMTRNIEETVGYTDAFDLNGPQSRNECGLEAQVRNAMAHKSKMYELRNTCFCRCGLSTDIMLEYG